MFVDAVFLADFAQCKKAVQIVPVVHQRLFHGLAHGLESCKMDNAVDGMAGYYLCQLFPVTYVGIIVRDTLAGNFKNRIEYGKGAVGIIIHTDHFKTTLE